MRAQTITIRTAGNGRGRRHVIVLALAVCSLAIPASASGFSSVNAITGDSEQSSQALGGSDYSSVNSITGGSSKPVSNNGSPYGGPGFQTPTAISGPSGSEPIVVSGPPAGTGEGFHWTDAALGAGAALMLVAFGGAALLTVRRRTVMTPST
jgi:hypothetical protein